MSNLSIYYTWKNIEKSYKNNTFKISTPTWNDKFELPDESSSVPDIQNYIEYIFKEKHNEKFDNPPMRIDKLMTEMHLRQPGFDYSACVSFTKNKERIQKFMQTGNRIFFC